jgi:hypothetical protein
LLAVEDEVGGFEEVENVGRENGKFDWHSVLDGRSVSS